MNFTPYRVLTFAEQHYDRGLVLRHDQAIGETVPMGQVLAQLNNVIAAGREHDSVDLVLSRTVTRFVAEGPPH